jgi:hypothetical protein
MKVTPLKHGRTGRTIKANVGKNIATELRSRVKPKQAIAIAFFDRRARRPKGSPRPLYSEVNFGPT